MDFLADLGESFIIGLARLCLAVIGLVAIVTVVIAGVMLFGLAIGILA